MPPGIRDKWNDNDVWRQSLLMTYSQIREYEEQEHNENMYKMLGAKSSLM